MFRDTPVYPIAIRIAIAIGLVLFFEMEATVNKLSVFFAVAGTSEHDL